MKVRVVHRPPPGAQTRAGERVVRAPRRRERPIPRRPLRVASRTGLTVSPR